MQLDAAGSATVLVRDWNSNQAPRPNEAHAKDGDCCDPGLITPAQVASRGPTAACWPQTGRSPGCCSSSRIADRVTSSFKNATTACNNRQGRRVGSTLINA